MPLEIDEEGNRCWRNDKGRAHREDGPAVEDVNGHKEWRRDDRCHRVDGPAVEYSNGSKYWYLNGEFLTKEEFEEVRD